jgi:hypothetical protein
MNRNWTCLHIQLNHVLELFGFVDQLGGEVGRRLSDHESMLQTAAIDWQRQPAPSDLSPKQKIRWLTDDQQEDVHLRQMCSQRMISR